MKENVFHLFKKYFRLCNVKVKDCRESLLKTEENNKEEIFLQLKVRKKYTLFLPMRLLRNGITVQAYLNILSYKIYIYCNKLAFDICK